MNRRISAVAPLLLLASCSDNDDVWSGASGWIIGLLLGILLIALILGVKKGRKK